MPRSLKPAEAIARARALVEHKYRTFSTEEGRAIMAGLLVALDTGGEHDTPETKKDEYDLFHV